jgi:uncharacterized membrane protein (UPF0127 family)
MLVKAHSDIFIEDFGLLRDGKIYLYYQCNYGDEKGERKGPVNAKRVQYSEVVRVNAAGVHKDFKVCCSVADTEEKKKIGLCNTHTLGENCGMFFPYLPMGEPVSIVQSDVKYPLDLIFVKNDKIVKLVSGTKVGSKDVWACKSCSGVIEVNAGFIAEHNLELGDKLALFAVGKADLPVLEEDKKFQALERSARNSYYSEYMYSSLVSSIVDNL